MADTPVLYCGHCLELLAILLLDWLRAALIPWACLRAAQVPVTPSLALAAFVLAQILGSTTPLVTYHAKL